MVEASTFVRRPHVDTCRSEGKCVLLLGVERLEFALDGQRLGSRHHCEWRVGRLADDVSIDHTLGGGEPTFGAGQRLISVDVSAYACSLLWGNLKTLPSCTASERPSSRSRPFVPTRHRLVQMGTTWTGMRLLSPGPWPIISIIYRQRGVRNYPSVLATASQFSDVCPCSTLTAGDGPLIAVSRLTNSNISCRLTQSPTCQTSPDGSGPSATRGLRLIPRIISDHLAVLHQYADTSHMFSTLERPVPTRRSCSVLNSY